MRLVHQEVNEEQGVREAMMAVGDSGSCIQLLAPLNDESTIAKFLDRSGPGIQQMAYRVTDLDAVSATLRERGLRLLTTSRAAAPPTPGSTSSTPRTPAASWSSSSNPHIHDAYPSLPVNRVQKFHAELVTATVTTGRARSRSQPVESFYY